MNICVLPEISECHGQRRNQTVIVSSDFNVACGVENRSQINLKPPHIKQILIHIQVRLRAGWEGGMRMQQYNDIAPIPGEMAMRFGR